MSFLRSTDIIYQLANLKQLTFEVTDACNLSCKYCKYGELYDDHDARQNIMMPVEYAYNLISYLTAMWTSEYNASNNVQVYISFYGGEPLLNMNFIKNVVAYIETHPCPTRTFVYSLTTNGTLLKQHIAYLAEKNFSLIISLDGDEFNSSYRLKRNGAPSYFDVMDNIKYIQSYYPGYFEQHVHFNSVLHNRNSVECIHSFFKNNFNKTPSIGELNDMGVRSDKYKEFNTMYQDFEKSLYDSSNKDYIENDMSIKTPTFQRLTHYVFQKSDSIYNDYLDLLFGKPKKKIPTGTCIPFSRRMFVTVNGKILPCERIGQQFALGYVTSDTISLDVQSIADTYNSYLKAINPQCRSCFNYDTCIQCVFNIENIEKGGKCPGMLSEEKYRQFEERQLCYLRAHPESYYKIMKEISMD